MTNVSLKNIRPILILLSFFQSDSWVASCRLKNHWTITLWPPEENSPVFSSLGTCHQTNRLFQRNILVSGNDLKIDLTWITRPKTIFLMPWLFLRQYFYFHNYIFLKYFKLSIITGFNGHVLMCSTSLACSHSFDIFIFTLF